MKADRLHVSVPHLFTRSMLGLSLTLLPVRVLSLGGSSPHVDELLNVL